MCVRYQHKRRILTCPHNGRTCVQPSHPCKRQQPLYVSTQEDVTFFNSSVLTEACLRTNQVFNTFVCYDLFILQLAIYNRHAAKVTITDRQHFSQSEISACKLSLHKFTLIRNWSPRERRQTWTKIKGAIAGNVSDGE